MVSVGYGIVTEKRQDGLFFEKISYLTLKNLVVPNLTPKVEMFLIRPRLKFMFPK